MPWVGFDIETSGDLEEYALQPWRAKDGQGWIRTYAESSAQFNRLVLPKSPRHLKEQLNRMVRDWEASGTVVCVWNGVFEISWLAAYVDHALLRRVHWLDGMLLWKHLENAPEYDTAAEKRRDFGLKKAVETFLPQYAGYDEGIDFHHDSTFRVGHYNACDALFTRAITRHLYTQLAAEPQRLRAAKIEAHSLADLGLANYEGVEIDEAGTDSLDAQLQQEAQDAMGRLQPHGATPQILRSPKQLGQLLFDDWGLEPLRQGKTGPSTDKETLHELAIHDPRVRDIRNYREANNNRTKFVVNIREAVRYNNDSRAHPTAKPFGTYSGRLTYGSSQGKGKGKRQIGWAIHQMKRSAEYRGLIKAPEGHVVVEFDAAGQEFRWMAVMSGDETMLSLCMPGEDPHSYMGASIAEVGYQEVVEGAAAGDPKLKAIRQLGKVANLALQYRTSAKKLLSTGRVQHGMDFMDLALAQKVHRTYQRTYPGVPRYWQRQIAHITRHLKVSTMAGRQVKVSARMLRSNEWSVQSTSINYPIQGTGADQKYLAMSVLRPVLSEHGARFLFDLHDGLYFIVPDDTAHEFIPQVRSLLDRLPYEKAWGFKPPIPLPWDCKVGTTWGNMKELK